MDKQDLLQQINQLYQQKNWREMKTLCAKGLQHFPKSASTYYNRAIARANLGELLEAKEDLEKALEIRSNPDIKQLLEKVQQKLDAKPHELSPSLLFKQNKNDLKIAFNAQEKIPEKFHHYQIKEELGSGGMGKVYKAFDSKMNRFVAIKVLHMQLKEKERFIFEAQILAKLQHPDVVTIYQIDFEPQNGYPYIVMDFIEGQTLAGKIFTSREALKVISQVAKAIDYAHSKGIIHRDLKPANIMLRKNKTPIVMDFGLAKQRDQDITKSGDILGTPRYMAPEQAQGKSKEVSAATDVYTLGVCLYELLTEETAVKGQNPAQVIYHILHTSSPPLQKYKPDLAKELSIICAKAMAKEQTKRYQSAASLAADIDRFLQGEIIKAQPFSLWYHLRHKIKKHRSIVIAVFAGILLLSLIFIYNRYKLHKKIAYYLEKSKQTFREVPKELRDISIEKFQTLQTNMAIENVLEKYLKAIEPLNKALVEDPHNVKVKMQQLVIYRNIGLLALAKKEYLLSSRAFKQCFDLDQKTGKALQALSKEQKEKELIHLEKIIATLEKKQPQLQQLERWAVEISRMKGTKVVKKLLPYVKSKNKWLRKLAVKALGQLGNTYTKVDGKDSIEWLLEALRKLKPLKDQQINEQNWEQNQKIIEIIETLGLLKDSRANKLIYKKRWAAGHSSILWNLTQIPYARIPLSKKEISTAQEFYVRGANKLQKGDLNGALESYNKVISLNLNYKGIYLSRGNLWVKKGNFKKAMEDYNKAIFLNSSNANTYTNRGHLWAKKGNFKKAMKDYNKAISFNPNSAKMYYSRGFVWERKRKWKKALNDYNRAISLNSNFINAYINRGNLWREKGKLEKALKDYNKAISLNPNNAKAYTNRGNFWSQKGEFEKAIRDFNKAIFLVPSSAFVYNNRGNLWDKKGMLEKAMKDYNKAISISPKDINAYNNRGNLWDKKGMLEKAMDDYNKAISISPKDAYAYNGRGNIFFKKGMLEKAMNNYNKAISINPEFAVAYNNKGNLWYKKKKLKKAIINYSKTISLDPQYTMAYYNMGTIWFKKGKWTKALKNYNKALSLNPKLAPIYKNRGITFLKKKLPKKAIADFKRYLALTPHAPDAPNVRAYIQQHR